MKEKFIDEVIKKLDILIKLEAQKIMQGKSRYDGYKIMNRFFSVDEIAEMFNVKKEFVEKIIKDGDKEKILTLQIMADKTGEPVRYGNDTIFPRKERWK